ncbi:MAG: hypothetical protein QNK27_08080 [Desulfuromusa sp.]|nr:hypothetical protein [Desulfuromusa sp.]
MKPIFTDLAVFDVDAEKGLTLTELAPGANLEIIKEKTACPFNIALTQ